MKEASSDTSGGETPDQIQDFHLNHAKRLKNLPADPGKQAKALLYLGMLDAEQERRNRINRAKRHFMREREKEQSGNKKKPFPWRAYSALSINQRLAVIGFCLLLAVSVWMMRYDIVGSGTHAAYILDRWTGGISICLGKRSCMPIPEPWWQEFPPYRQ